MAVSPTEFSRRLFLGFAGSLSSLALLNRRAVASPRHAFQSNPFTLGVASGDPDDRSVVLWTRLAPEPLIPGGGMPVEAFEVQWEVSNDDSFKDIVQSGKEFATPQLGHSVHAEVQVSNQIVGITFASVAAMRRV